MKKKKVIKRVDAVKIPQPEAVVLKPIMKKPFATYKCPTCKSIYREAVQNGIYSPNKACLSDNSLMEAIIIYE